jgi:hypothetical protein
MWVVRRGPDGAPGGDIMARERIADRDLGRQG